MLTPKTPPSTANLVGWFVMLAICAGGLMLVGPAPSSVALFSKSDGLFMTFGSVYALAATVAFFLSMLLVQWHFTGWNGFFELRSGDVINAPLTANWSRTATVAAYVGFSLLACYLIFVQSGGTLVSTMLHDTFVYYDGAHRIDTGQVQHLDFHTPMGAVCNILPYWGLRLSGRYAGSLEIASLIAAAFFLIVATPGLAMRYVPAVTIPLVIFLCLLVVVPLGVQETPDQISHSMFYNRFGWAGLTLLFLYFVNPRKPTRNTCWLDAACMAAMLLFLFYLKITYFLVGFAFLPLVACFSAYGLRVALLTTAILLPMIGVLEFFYGFNAAYLHDLLMTIKASGANRGAMVTKLFRNLNDFTMVAIAVGLTVCITPKKLSFLAFAGYVFMAGLAIIDQNTHSLGVICWLAIPAVAQETIRRAAIIEPEGQKRDLGMYSSVACAGMILLFVVQPIVFRCTTMAMIRSAVSHVADDLPGGLNGIVFGEQLSASLTPAKQKAAEDDEQSEKPAEDQSHATYLETILEGVADLKELGTTGKSVTVLDFVNPMSFILDMEPASGDHTCIHYGRTMSDKNFSPPEELLGSVDYVMVPKLPSVPRTTEFLVRTYGDYLDRHFAQVKQSNYWTIWARKSPGA